MNRRTALILVLAASLAPAPGDPPAGKKWHLLRVRFEATPFQFGGLQFAEADAARPAAP